MFASSLSATRKLLLATSAAALLSLAAIPLNAQPDPPSQAGRISYISGTVSIQPAGVDAFEQAIPNLPLGPGDRVVTDSDGQAEVQVGRTFVRIGPNADVSFVDSTSDGIYFGVAQGPVHVRTDGLWEDQALYIQTPSGSATLTTIGEVRVDVMPDEQAAIFTSFGTDLMITGAGGFTQPISAGQALELVGSNPVYPQWLQPAPWDPLDSWSHQRDQLYYQSLAYQYVSREIPGAYELDASGTWLPGTEYGSIWFPNTVPAGWAPYHYGHWVNHAPWGWVWVEDEPWGYAPFHYGRWVSFAGRWGWIPGPPAEHPVWSPALVVFAGGIHFGGVGVSAWFPLGPGEPYRPWYPCSQRYVDRVNISNITEAPRVHVQQTYININITNVVYVNRTIAVTAVRHEDFASGRSVSNASIAVDPHAFEHVQVLAAPEPKPTAASFVAGPPPVRTVRVSVERPVLINQQGKAVVAKPGAQAVEPTVKTVQAPHPMPGRTVVAPPPTARPVPAANQMPAAKPPVPPATMQPKSQPAPRPAPPTVAAPKTAPAPVPTPKAAPAPSTAPRPAPATGAAPKAVPPTTPAPGTKPAKPGTTPPAKTNKTKPEDKTTTDKPVQ